VFFLVFASFQGKIVACQGKKNYPTGKKINAGSREGYCLAGRQRAIAGRQSAKQLSRQKSS